MEIILLMLQSDVNKARTLYLILEPRKGLLYSLLAAM